MLEWDMPWAAAGAEGPATGAGGAAAVTAGSCTGGSCACGTDRVADHTVVPGKGGETGTRISLCARYVSCRDEKPMVSKSAPRKNVQNPLSLRSTRRKPGRACSLTVF